MVNETIRFEMMRKKISQWKLAEALGISESSLNRKLRKELSAEEKEELLNTIKEMKPDDNYWFFDPRNDHH